MSENCQDNKCKRNSQSTIIINLGVAAYEDSNVVGERFWQDLSKMKYASDSRDQGLRPCTSGFSIKFNGHGVIVDGVRGLYFGLIFRRRKRFWED